jgi:FtsH-binding integral membrane protein
MLNGWNYLGIVIISFIALFTVLLTSNNNNIIKYSAWTVFMISIGIISYISYKLNKINNKLNTVFISLLIIIIVLSGIAYYKPLNTFDNWGNPLLAILIALIIIQIVDYMFFVNKDNFINRFRIYSWISLLLFSGFLLYDTQKLVKEAIVSSVICNEIKQPQLRCVDYPRASLGIFIDILNLFTSLSNINN